MTNLESHARRELEIAGLLAADSPYGGMLGEAVLKLVRLFADEGHSGHSASMAVSIFEKVSRFEPLSPLTGEDGEWFECHEGCFQNKRCSHVFKQADRFDGQAYDIEARIFREADGSCWQNSESHQPITFPYTPSREYVTRETV